MKIYAIDDEKASLYFLSKAIKEVCPNDELKEFSIAEEFIENFKIDLPDIVFLDIEMPEIGGIDLAKMLIEIKKDVNIIFVTAFTQYALDAFGVNATGYIVKPVKKEDIQNALQNLRYTVEDNEVVIKTFGNFDIFISGSPIRFRSPKSKEVLAYLVDRQGGMVSKKELGAAIYEDDYSNSIQAILSRNIKYLEEDLESAGITGLLVIENGNYYVELSNTSCDLIDYLSGKSDVYLGEYMEQYSWAETKKANLRKII